MDSALEDVGDQWVTSFIGLQKSSKFIIEDDRVLLVNCPLLLLQNINFKDPLGDALLESLQSFHMQYGCGINTLLCMWCVWNKGIRHVLSKGLSFSSMLETLTESLNYVISSMHEQEILLQFALPLLYRHRRNVNADTKARTLNSLYSLNYNFMKCHINPKKNITETAELSEKDSHCSMQYNRHLIYSYRLYNDVDSISTESCSNEDSDQRETKCLSIKSSLEDTGVEKEISTLLSEISHGSSFLVPLVTDVWKRQLENSSEESFSFCKDKILTFPISGYKFKNSMVVDGIVIKFSSHRSQDLFLSDKSMLHRSLLVGGSVTPNYVHLGFAPDISIEKVASCISESDDEIWLQKTVQTLHKLKVSALLVEGTVDERLVNTLQGSIIIIPYIPHSSLCKLAKSTSRHIISYIENSDEVNICNVVIEPFELRKGLEESEKLFVVNVPGKSICQCVIICHELLSVAHQLEHTFWHLISRLSNICLAKKLLPGGGQTEKFCVRKLQEFHEKNDEIHVCKVEALNILSDGFLHYANKIDKVKAEISVQNDPADETSNNIVYDDPLSKIEGWKTALKLALLLSQVDSVIINGLTEESEHNLFFHKRATFQL